MEEYQVQSGNLGISGNGKALDYKAIFGALSSCSIPFLDLPSVDNDLEFRHCSVSDYSDIFRGTDDRNFAASLEELLALRDSSEIITRDLRDVKLQAGSSSKSSDGDDESKRTEMNGLKDVSVVKNKQKIADEVILKASSISLDAADGGKRSNRLDCLSGSKNKHHFVDGVTPSSNNYYSAADVKRTEMNEPDHVGDIENKQNFVGEVTSSSNNSDSPADVKRTVMNGPDPVVDIKNKQNLSDEVTLKNYTPSDHHFDAFVEDFGQASSSLEDQHHFGSSLSGKFSPSKSNDLSLLGNLKKINPHSADSEDFKENGEVNEGFTTNKIITNSSEGLTIDEKSTPGSPPCSSSPSSENYRIHNQATEFHHSRSSSTTSLSSLDRMFSNDTFLKVTDISLRTKPLKVPPPRRAPPSRPPPKLDSDHSNKPTSIDAEASVAAMKKAMEVAQLRLRSAKASLEKKRESLQNQKREVGQEKITISEESGEWKVDGQFYDLMKIPNLKVDEKSGGQLMENVNGLRSKESGGGHPEKLETKWRSSKEAFICEVGDYGVLRKPKTPKISEQLKRNLVNDVICEADSEGKGNGEERKRGDDAEAILLKNQKKEGRRNLEEAERLKGKLEEERERRRLEEERESARRLQEEEERERARRLQEEEEIERKLEEEEEREKERLRILREKEDTERRKTEEEQERRRLEERQRATSLHKDMEERERRLEEEVAREKEKLRLLREKEEVERRKAVEEEKERRQLEKEREREEKLRLVREEDDAKRRQAEEEEKERRRFEERERERRLQEDNKERERRLQEEEEREKEKQRIVREEEDKERARSESREVEEREGSNIKAEDEGGTKSEERVRGKWKIEEERMKFRKQESVIERQEKQRDKRRTEKGKEIEMDEDEREREREREKDRQAAERAAREANERALAEKGVAIEKSLSRLRADKSATTPGLGGSEAGETPIRCRARMERHQRTVERAAKALAEKNMRDVIAQREQAERNRLAESLDAEIRRWSNGKEGNLRALLSTLQYILGGESGWQPVPLTEVLTAQGVKKVYRKATLCVHPDKLQQRGASIQHKYICEKVFDLLKEAWSRFNSEER